MGSTTGKTVMSRSLDVTDIGSKMRQENKNVSCRVYNTLVKGNRKGSSECELKHLRGALIKSKGLVELDCLARVDWAHCIQEWYLKDSYDAKRRAHQLRALGFLCEAKNVGAIPLKFESGIELVKVTILTAWREDGLREQPPVPLRYMDGLILSTCTK
jgi:hypothetical protein